MATGGKEKDGAGNFGREAECTGIGPMDENVLAASFADMLARGKDKKSIDEVVKFLQLVIALLKTYT